MGQEQRSAVREGSTHRTTPTNSSTLIIFQNLHLSVS